MYTSIIYLYAIRAIASITKTQDSRSSFQERDNATEPQKNKQKKFIWIPWESCYSMRGVIHDSPEFPSHTFALPSVVLLSPFTSSYQRDIQKSVPWSKLGYHWAHRHRWLKWYQKAVIISAGHPFTLTRPGVVDTLTLHVPLSLSVCHRFWAKRRLAGANLHLHLEAKDRKITDEGNPGLHSNPVKELVSYAAWL